VKTRLPRILGASAVVAAAAIYAVTFVLHEGEGALSVRFGSPVRVLAAPRDAGVHLTWPWPIEKVYRYDMRERIFEGGLEEASTADGQLVVAGVFVLWRVGDPRAFHEAVMGREAAAEPLIGGALRSGVNDVLARHRYAALTQAPPAQSGGGAAGELEKIETEIARLLREPLGAYGIEIVAAGFHQLVLPEKAAEGVFAQMRQAKERDAARIQSEGDAQARKIKAEAQRDYERSLAEARTRAGEIAAKAKAEAAGVLAAVDNKDLLAFLDRLTALEEVFAGPTTIVWDLNTPPLDLLKELAPAGAGGAAGTEERR
jgi:membrane protease subunit HflC